jgi:PAS domain S-box-containing protein
VDENFEKNVKDLLLNAKDNIDIIYKMLMYAPMAIHIALEDGTCVFENLAMRAMLDDENAKVLGTNIFTLSSVKDTGLLEYYKKTLGGQIIRLKNYRFKSSLTGKELLSDITIFPFITKSQKAVVTFFYDTKKNFTELVEKKIKSLELDREFSSIILNHAPMSIFSIDASGKIFSANNAAAKIFGEENKYITEKNVFDLTERGKSRLKDILKRSLKGIPFEGELHFEHQEKKEYYVYDFVITPVYNENEEVTAVLVMYSDVTERFKIRKALQEDLALARKIQSSIISDNYKKDIDELEIYVHYQPMGEVGGDFYDITKLMPSGKIRVFVTDATGHGVQGALTTMLIKSEYEKVKIFDLPPNKVLDIVNNNFVSFYPNLNIYFTCFIADIDLEKMMVSYSSAGHPEQFLLRNDKIYDLSCRGRYLGIFEKSEYQLREMPLDIKDRLFFFTDGLYEEFSEDDEFFGSEKLKEVILSNNGTSLEKHGHGIVTDIFGFKGWSSINDDITFIAAEILNV